MSLRRGLPGALLRLSLGLTLAACSTTTDRSSVVRSAPLEETIAPDVTASTPAPPPAFAPAGAALVCGRLDFGGIDPIVLDGASQEGGQNVPAGMTPSGSTILVQHGGCSSGLALSIADETPAGSGSGAYTSLDVPPFAWMDTSFEENVTLTADGLTLIGLGTKGDFFLESSRSGVGKVDFSTPTHGPFASIVAMGRQTLWAPLLSADGLAFYYVIKNDPSPAVNGIYESLRASRSASFPIGTRMPDAIQNVAQYVNAVSEDRLSIFLEAKYEWKAFVFTRARLGDEFRNPLAPNSPPTVPGLRTRPIAGCHRLIGTCAPNGGSGCMRERVCAWSSDGPRRASPPVMQRAVSPGPRTSPSTPL